MDPLALARALKGARRAEPAVDLWVLACATTRLVKGWVLTRPKRPESQGWQRVGEVDLDKISEDELAERISLAVSMGLPAYEPPPG